MKSCLYPTFSSRLRRAIRVGAVVGAVFVAGPAATVGCRGGELAVDEIVTRIQAAQADISSTHIVADISVQMPGFATADTSMDMSIEQWMAGDKLRMEYTDGPEELKGAVMVMNAGTLSMYMPATNDFFTTAIPDAGGDISSPAQAAAMTREWVTQILNTNTISLAGIEEVAGRRTYQLTAVPKATSEAEAPAQDGSSTLWVDTETFYPLKMDLAMGPMHMTMTTREVEYNPILAPETFFLEAPEGAQTSDISLPQMDTTTAAAAQEQVDFELLEVAAGSSDFVLENTTVSGMPGASGESFSIVMQTYRGPAGTIAVQQMPAIEGFDMAAGMGAEAGTRTVDIGGREASLTSLGMAGAMLSWQDGETQVTVSGQVVEEALLAFATSLR